MARETREEKAARLAQEQLAAEEALAAYTKTVPKRLVDAQAWAQSVGVSTGVTLTESGPSVHFYDSNTNFDDHATYQIEEWELEYIERKLRDLKEEQDARRHRKSVAEAAWADLSTEERVAIKENIYTLPK